MMNVFNKNEREYSAAKEDFAAEEVRLESERKDDALLRNCGFVQWQE